MVSKELFVGQKRGGGHFTVDIRYVLCVFSWLLVRLNFWLVIFSTDCKRGLFFPLSFLFHFKESLAGMWRNRI